MQKRLNTLGITILLAASVAAADEQTYWAQKAQNPMAEVMKLPIENRFDTGYGYKDALNYRLSFQPSMVSEISKDWNMVNRFDVPFMYQPGRTPGEKDSWGLGDITYESFYGPSKARNFFWGLGPTFQIPTATDPQLGTKKWSAGIAGTGSIVKGPIVAGVRVNQLWSFAGKDDRPDVNQMAFEYFIYANLGSGWWIGTSPVNMANWEAPSDQTWTIPLGGGFGKMVGSRVPLNLKVEAYGYADAPDNYADWSVLFGLEYLIPANSLFKR